MEYNSNLWDTYTDDNFSLQNQTLPDFIYNSSLILGAKKVCEVGCNVGNNLFGFPKNYDVTGIDLNEHALKQAQIKFPNFKFQNGSILDLPFDTDSFDLVFTRGVLIHIHPNNLKSAMNELFRVSKTWIFNLEYYGENNKMIDWKRGKDLLWYRDMESLWKQLPVELISNVDVPTELDNSNTRFTLVRKNATTTER